MEIAQSIEDNLVPWTGAWDAPQPSEWLRADSYQRVLSQYTKSVSEYAVSIQFSLTPYGIAKARGRHLPFRTGKFQGRSYTLLCTESVALSFQVCAGLWE